ncbi:unnamed protein product [Somion occarium]|uniref:Protein kinase domain-containing protein n=1 Tax=Somion occarium TaxID=3059160 RepID=A0ABP1E2V2_9APHY
MTTVTNFVPSNAIASISLVDAVYEPVPGGKSVADLELKRGVATCNKPYIRSEPDIVSDYIDSDSDEDDFKETIGPEPPARLPSKLPPPGKLHASLRLTRRIASGRAGIVFEAELDEDASSPKLTTASLPRLIVKVCRPTTYYRVSREAFYYEEMESLQGRVIPRYYGLFQTTLEPGVMFRYWKMEKIWGGNDANDSDEEDHSDFPRFLTVLVLEYVSEEFLPVGRKLDDKIIKEIKEMFKELARLGVWQPDIRYANILRVPNAESGKAGQYRWRLVDFDRARKSNMSLERFEIEHDDLLEPLFEWLPRGVIRDPWAC